MVEPQEQKQCLLIIPRHFYSFEKFFTEILIKKGYAVTVSNDEYPSNNFGKIIGKILPVLLEPLTERVITREYLNGKKYDVVLIFKGRGLGLSLIKKLKEASSKIVAYNWDSFAFNSIPLNWYKEVQYYTFDYKDADQYKIPVVELFSSISASSEQFNKKNKLSAIFRNHSGRIRYLDKILKVFKEEDTRIYIYEQNIFFCILNFIKNPGLYLKYRKHIFFKPLTYNQYISILSESEYTIDYAHPLQTGLTMRSFEALSTATKIITNNSYVCRSRFFDDNNALVFTENAAIEVLVNNLNNPHSKLGNQTIRTKEDFIDELLK